MRTLALGALAMAALVGGCSAAHEGDATQGGERIACALGGATTFTQDCTVERVVSGQRVTLTVRHPDGAFRRFSVVRDGRGLVVADGADQARTTIEGDKLAVAVAQDRYLFPATIKAGSADARP